MNGKSTSNRVRVIGFAVVVLALGAAWIWQSGERTKQESARMKEHLSEVSAQTKLEYVKTLRAKDKYSTASR